MGQQKVAVIIAEHIINILEVREISIDNSKLFRPGVQKLLGFFLESAKQVNPGKDVYKRQQYFWVSVSLNPASG